MTARGKIGLAVLGAAVLAFGSVCPTIAQGPPAGGGPGGGGRGMRMFGMGGMRGGLFLLRNKSVQDELGMTQPQIQKLDDMQQQMRQQFRQNNPGGPGGQPGTPPDPAARQQMFQSMQTQQQAAVAQILDTKQQKRFAQIQLQLGGYMVFQQKDVATKLALTAAQSTQIRKIASAAMQQIQTARQGLDFRTMTDADRQKMMDKFQAYQKVVTSKMVEVLTPAQKTRWTAMLGKPFTYVNDPNQFMGGRRRGGGAPPAN